MPAKPALPVTVQTPPVQTPGDPHRWPDGQPLPVTYRILRRAPVPCPQCRRVTLDTGSPAAVRTKDTPDCAHFRCRACGHRWKLCVVVVA
jgi:hypothetical protein